MTIRWRIILLVLFLLFAPVLDCYAAECKPAILSPGALNLVKSVMELRLKQYLEESSQDSRGPGASRLNREMEKRFYTLLDTRSAMGEEALAYLCNVNMGEHLGEELVCEVINRGKRMLPLIKSYKECLPNIGIETLPKEVRETSYIAYIEERIGRGEKCSYEN